MPDRRRLVGGQPLEFARRMAVGIDREAAPVELTRAILVARRAARMAPAQQQIGILRQSRRRRIGLVGLVIPGHFAERVAELHPDRDIVGPRGEGAAIGFDRLRPAPRVARAVAASPRVARDAVHKIVADHALAPAPTGALPLRAAPRGRVYGQPGPERKGKRGFAPRGADDRPNPWRGSNRTVW